MKINKEELISSPSKRLAFLYNAKRYDTKDTISLNSLFKGNQVSSIIVNDIDGVKIDFPDRWVHLRKSNTEPIIRVYSEAQTMEMADELGKKLMKVVYDMQ
jgi:phosphomannomutase